MIIAGNPPPSGLPIHLGLPSAQRQRQRPAEFGLERDGHVFRRYSSAGDVVLVDLQSHRAFVGETRFYDDIGFLLAPYRQWQVHDRDLPASRKPDTYFNRVLPPASDEET